MSKWQILGANNVPTGEVFDDGVLAGPGEDGFTATLVAAHVAQGQSYNYMGPSPNATPTAHTAADGRRLIPKSTIQERVNDLGKLGAAFALLQAQPIMFGRWFAPDWPSVYADDPSLLQMLAAIGLTSDEIATVTA